MSTTTLICVLAYFLAIAGLMWWHERSCRLHAEMIAEDALIGWAETLDEIEAQEWVRILDCPDEVTE